MAVTGLVKIPSMTPLIKAQVSVMAALSSGSMSVTVSGKA